MTATTRTIRKPAGMHTFTGKYNSVKAFLVQTFGAEAVNQKAYRRHMLTVVCGKFVININNSVAHKSGDFYVSVYLTTTMNTYDIGFFKVDDMESLLTKLSGVLVRWSLVIDSIGPLLTELLAIFQDMGEICQERYLFRNGELAEHTNEFRRKFVSMSRHA